MPFIAQQPEHFVGKKIGDGGPYAFVQRAAHPPSSATWRPGVRLKGAEAYHVQRGTVIAALRDGHILSEATGPISALFMGIDVQGIRVLIQHPGQPVGFHTLPFAEMGHPLADGSCWYVVE